MKPKKTYAWAIWVRKYRAMLLSNKSPALYDTKKEAKEDMAWIDEENKPKVIRVEIREVNNDKRRT